MHIKVSLPFILESAYVSDLSLIAQFLSCADKTKAEVKYKLMPSKTGMHRAIFFIGNCPNGEIVKELAANFERLNSNDSSNALPLASRMRFSN